MESVKAMATFQQIGEEIYRTNTFIQFGSSNQSLGATVLLNPGSAELKGEAKRKLLQKGTITDETTLDGTMRQLVSFMKETHSTLDGRLHLYNLFYVRNADSRKAIELFELLKTTRSYPSIALPSFNEMKQHPWILIGWGVEKKKSWTFYEAEKNKWLQLIESSGIPHFGVLSKENEYYHPCPNSPAKSERLEQLIKSYKENIEPRILLNH